MRLVVDVLHPAHVHVFRNFVTDMQDRGHEVLVTARDKDLALPLLRAYDIPHVVLSRQARGAVALAVELVLRTARFVRRARPFKPDLLVGIMGPTIALAGKLLRARTVIFYDTEMARVTNWFAYPLADAVCTPECYQGSAGRHHVRYPGYHELAYLHPRRFSPDPEPLRSAGLSPEAPFFLVRFVSFEASHDRRERGLTAAGKRRLVATLQRHGRVLVSSEAPLPPDLEPYRFPLAPELVHHAIAHARLVVGESATMASEAAVLGTPAVFISRTGRGYTDEQERRYGLVHNFTDREEEAAIECVERLAAQEDLKEEAAAARERLLSERIDVTSWMVAFCERGGLPT